jgi:hypothetical protein
MPRVLLNFSTAQLKICLTCCSCSRMNVRIRMRSVGAVWVFAPVAGNWASLGYQMITYSASAPSLPAGREGSEFGRFFSQRRRQMRCNLKYCAGCAVAYSSAYSILAIAAFNEGDNRKWPDHTYDLKSHGSVYLYRRQNTNAPASAGATHNQFAYATKLNATGYTESQRNYFGNCIRQQYASNK